MGTVVGRMASKPAWLSAPTEARYLACNARLTLILRLGPIVALSAEVLDSNPFRSCWEGMVVPVKQGSLTEQAVNLIGSANLACWACLSLGDVPSVEGRRAALGRLFKWIGSWNPMMSAFSHEDRMHIVKMFAEARALDSEDTAVAGGSATALGMVNRKALTESMPSPLLVAPPERSRGFRLFRKA